MTAPILSLADAIEFLDRLDIPINLIPMFDIKIGVERRRVVKRQWMIEIGKG